MTVGVFKDESQAQQALDSLKSAGFDQVQFLRPGRGSHQSGGLFSGIKRLFTGDNEGIEGNLTDTGVSEGDARYYQQEYEAGRIIITVRAGDRKQEALDILRRYGAYDAFKRDPQNAATLTSTASETEAASTSTTASNAEIAQPAETASASTTAPVVEQETDETTETLLTPPSEDLSGTYDRHHLNLNKEQLNVSKQPVQTGEVELHKEVVTEQRTLDVPVTHEEVVVTRHPVSDSASDMTSIGQGEEIRVPVTEERVEVTKTPVVTGEVTLEKRAVEKTEHVSNTIKREEIRVEQEGDAPIHGTPSDRFHYDKQKQRQANKPRAKSRKKR
jgi:uncharacterized protein (TIGR02271 family)